MTLALKNLLNRVIENIINARVVILIDEYDKAILDNLDQIEIAIQNREVLKALYGIIKDNGKYIKFVFLTGGE